MKSLHTCVRGINKNINDNIVAGVTQWLIRIT